MKGETERDADDEKSGNETDSEEVKETSSLVTQEFLSRVFSCRWHHHHHFSLSLSLLVLLLATNISVIFCMQERARHVGQCKVIYCKRYLWIPKNASSSSSFCGFFSCRGPLFLHPSLSLLSLSLSLFL